MSAQRVALSLALQTSRKTKQVTSQSWAPLDAHYGWASLVADRQSTEARRRTSVDDPSPHHCSCGINNVVSITSVLGPTVAKQ